MMQVYCSLMWLDKFQKIPSDHRPVWFIYSGMGSQWAGMGRELMSLEPFARAIRHCHEVLLPYGVNLLELIREPDDNTVSNPLLSAVCIIAIQVY